MIDALYISATGLRSQQEQIDVISNNVANMSTPGFKKSRVSFAEVSGISGPDLDAARPQFSGGGIQVLETRAVFSEGELRPTQGVTDLAIEGAGFFELETVEGAKMYTRAGQFRVDAEGYLVAINGARLSGDVQIPADASDVRIAQDGAVTARLGTDVERSQIGQVQLASFAAPDALHAIGQNAFEATQASGEATVGAPGETGLGHVRQGFLEMANVDMVDEMTSLVLAQRAYQLNARVLQAADQVLETINNLRR